MHADKMICGGDAVMRNARASGWRKVLRLFSLSLPPFPAVTLVVALTGCEPFPAHLDPLSVNGRDGGGKPPSYEALLRIGAAARAGGDLADALSVYRRAAEIKPSDPTAFIAIGNTLVEIGSVDEAILAYNSALARDGSDLAAQLGLARAYLETGRPQLARVPLAQALAQSPDNPKGLLLTGVTEDLAGQHPAAQVDYRRGLKSAPTDAALTIDLALSLALSGNFAAAIDELEPVAMAPSGSPRERQTLALIYGLEGNYAEAARIGGIDLDPASVQSNLAYYRTLRDLPPDALGPALLAAASRRPGQAQ